MTLRELIVEKFLEEARKEVSPMRHIKSHHPKVELAGSADSGATIEWMKDLLERAMDAASSEDPGWIKWSLNQIMREAGEGTGERKGDEREGDQGEDRGNG